MLSIRKACMASWRTFRASQAGSVSVLLMLLVAPLFIFHAVLIDQLRIRSSERETEAGLKLALRSVLSAYDPEIKNYGLYAVGPNATEAEQLYRHVLERNRTSYGGGFVWIRPEPNVADASLTPVYTLGNQIVFRQQVLEEMKYRAPAEFTVNVIDKLTGSRNPSSALSAASSFEKRAEEVERLIDSREDALDRAWAALLQLQEKSGVYKSYYSVRLNDLNAYAMEIGGHEAAEIERSIETLRGQSDQLAQALAGQQRSLGELVRHAKENAQLISDLMRSISLLQSQLSTVTFQIDGWQKKLRMIAEFTVLLKTTQAETVRDAERLKQVQDEIMARLEEAQACDTKIRELAASEGNATFMTPELLNRTVLPESYYTLYKVESSAPYALMNGFSLSVQATALFLGEYSWTNERYITLTASNDAYAERAGKAVARLQTEEEKRLQTGENTRRQKKEQLDRLGEALEQVQKLVAECGGIMGGSAIYGKLEQEDQKAGDGGLYAKYIRYNRLADESDSENPDFPSDGTKARKRAFGLVDTLLPLLSSLGQSLRNEIYLNEYVLEKFNYRTFGKELGSNGRPVPVTALTNPAQHRLVNQEAEYLLYGQTSCVLNQSAAYAEMFALRLAVRTTEALLSPTGSAASAGSPLVMVFWATAQGAVEAYRDMTELIAGKPVPLSAKLTGDAVELRYKDYLRLFYLLHSHNERMLARMQSLIEINTGRDLTHKATYVQGTLQSSERLWFFPYLSSLFQEERQGSRVLRTQTAFASY